MIHLPEALPWPLVGREAELERIAGLRAGGGPTGVVLAAPAGVGKSRLAREAVAAAKTEGALTAWVQATRSAAAVPLGAFAGLVPGDVRSDDPLELMRRSVEALRGYAGDRPVVVGVDDAQLLDATSAALVLQLVMAEVAWVIATVRAAEPCPDAVESLWKDAGAARLDLHPLTEPVIARLVEQVLGGPVTQHVRQWVFETSQGNALYLRELLLGALDDGSLEEAHGIWRLTRRPRLSTSLAALVDARLEGLTADERRTIELLALGEPLRMSEVVALVGADGLAGAESRGLVRVDDGGAEVRLGHPLYGEVVRASMPVIRASAARRELARLVGGRADRTQDDALRIARWLLDAGEAMPAALLVEAARAANQASDPELGGRLAALAVEGGAGVEASLLLARALALRNRHQEAEAVLAALEGRIEDRDAAIAYVQQRSTVLFWGLHRMDDALALLDRAQTWWTDQAWLRTLGPLRLHLVSIDGGFGAELGVIREILADPELEPDVRRRMELVYITNLFYSGRVREARALLLERLPPVPLRDEYDELAAIIWCVVSLESGWDLAAAEMWGRHAIEAAVQAGDHGAAGIAAATLGGVAMLAGRYADAWRWSREAAVHLGHHDPFQTLKSIRGVQVGIGYYTGDLEGAARATKLMREAIGDRPVIDTDRAYVVRGEAWTALVEGDPPTAQRILLENAERMGPVPVYASQLYHEAMRAGAAARTVAGPLAALRERCDARLTAAYADHAEALAASDGEALLACAEEFADIGTLRYAVECAAEAAEAFAAEGRQDTARRAAALSRELDPGQGGVLPPIRGLEDATVTLTPREAQLVELASRGLSNGEIADRLVLSVRTVESHMYRAMQKLGVSDRRDL